MNNIESSQNIDELIKRIKLVAKNRYPLSDIDREILPEAADNLEKYKRSRKFSGVVQLLLIAKAIGLYLSSLLPTTIDGWWKRWMRGER